MPRLRFILPPFQYLSTLCAVAAITGMPPRCAGQAILSGTWSAVSQTLDNGEENRTFFTLRQQADQLTGRFHTLGWGADVKGSIENGHFKLYAAYNPSAIFAQGEVSGADLSLTMEGEQHLLLKPVLPTEREATVAYIPPPALKTLPSNGLAKTPPMGWNSWNKFGGSVSDAVVRGVADAMAANGMRDAGYVYLNIDDTWEGVRDARGVLQPNHKFPDMKALADYVHARGLKLGIYSSPGPRTCGGYPGSYGHETIDAQTWAAWGIDYVKYDWCSAETVYQQKDLRAIYQKMGEALEATSRPMVYSLCEYGEDHVETWGPAAGANLWRTTGDIRDEWQSMADRNGFSQNALAPYAAPGQWNDPDMLEVGNGHMSPDEYRTHMSLWSLLAAPLLAGNDVRQLSAEVREILLNRDVIAIDQDAKGVQGTRLYQRGNEEVWTKPLANGDLAVGLFNRGPAAESMTLRSSDLGRTGDLEARDLWTHSKVIPVQGAVTTRVPSHGVLLLRVPAL